MSSTSRKRKAQSQNPHHNQEEQKCEETSEDQEPINVPYLPNPIVIEILSRVRIKTLFSCRLVCKNWAALTSTPDFAEFHLSRSPNSCLIKPLNKKRQSRRLHLIDPECPYSLSNKLVFIPKINLPNVPIDLINSCNGLVCLCQLISHDSSDACNIYVCNPVLGEYITLPKPPDFTKFDSRDCVFGFSHKTNQYKVILTYYNSGNSRTEIYTVGEGSWRSIANSPYPIWNNNFYACLNGSLHWIPSTLQCPFIGCFDFASEQFGGVPEPSEFGLLERQSSDQMRVGVINGNLSLCDFNYAVGVRIVIWEMKDYGVKESWSKYIVITHMIYDTDFDTYEPIMIKGNGEILMIFNNDSIMLYDPKCKCFESELKIYGISSEFHAIAHVPSLISLKDVAKGENLKFLLFVNNTSLSQLALPLYPLLSPPLSLHVHTIWGRRSEKYAFHCFGKQLKLCFLAVEMDDAGSDIGFLVIVMHLCLCMVYLLGEV
ncbi:hypothetical protein LguiB_028336 [Lonicera macranthoides]